MKLKLSPLLIGVITAAVMIGVAMFIFYSNQPESSLVQYLVYIVYGIGIVLALQNHRRKETSTGTFGDLFSQGFKCFIIVTLLMVLFTFIFTKLHPEFAEAAGKYLRENLTAQKKLPSEIDETVMRYKNNYATIIVFGAIFGYLIIGAAVSAAASLILSRRKP
jgi:uncharacterized membrane protein YraQ (UPF0718 family)